MTDMTVRGCESDAPCAFQSPDSDAQVLRLPPVRVTPIAPAYGMLSLTLDGAPAGLGASTPFWPLLEWVGQHCFSALLPLSQALVQLQGICASVKGQLLWCLAPKTYEFEVCSRAIKMVVVQLQSVCASGQGRCCGA